jgi:hypothetical protein
MPRTNLFHGPILFAASPAGVRHVLLVGFLLAGDAHLFGVHDHHEIAGVQVGGKDRFVLAAQNVGNLNRQAAQHRAVGVNDVPLALVEIHFRQIRFHSSPI